MSSGLRDRADKIILAARQCQCSLVDGLCLLLGGQTDDHERRVSILSRQRRHDLEGGARRVGAAQRAVRMYLGRRNDPAAAVVAIDQYDLPIVQGVVVFGTLAIIVFNLAVDILYAWIDPRIRLE